ncbi:hypothetical protein D9758_010370 [Tetrapyrgos nigripes]|uniref:DUF6699 domain-containing protein n=1 Tax=Tetrapyrgos nigripes TaxID=182062 RepID=A0A8H5D133_9AGAR|nr:hypothetical protein D9758_010370 [Tetrapyrgos nigripes]
MSGIGLTARIVGGGIRSWRADLCWLMYAHNSSSNLPSHSVYTPSLHSHYTATSSTLVNSDHRTRSTTSSHTLVDGYPYDADASFKSNGSHGRASHVPFSPSSSVSDATWGEGPPSHYSVHHALPAASPFRSSHYASSLSSVSPHTQYGSPIPSTPRTAQSPSYTFKDLSNLSSNTSYITPYSLHPFLINPSSSGLFIDLTRHLSSSSSPSLSSPATSTPKSRLLLRLTRISPDLFLVVNPHSTSTITVSDIFHTLTAFLLSPLSHPSELARLPPNTQKRGKDGFGARSSQGIHVYKRGMLWGDCLGVDLERGRAKTKFGGLVFSGVFPAFRFEDGYEAAEGVWEVVFV